MPTPTSATTSPRANGITLAVVIAITTISVGASEWRNRLAAAGTMSSLKMSLNTSANGCNSPFGPTRFGPERSWMNAATFRSA